jgi:Vitamin B12 dependent methionine synthase, activation domain
LAVLEGFDYDINVDDVLTFMGYDEERPAPKRLREKAQAMREKCLELVKPRSVYQVYEFLDETLEMDGDAIRIGNSKLVGEFRGKILRKVLKGSLMAIVFVGTLGPDIDEEIDKLNSEGDDLTALILDTMGLYAFTKSKVRFLKELYTTEAKPRDFSLTEPFGPGQCHWDIREQKEIFTLIDADLVGVKLTESYMMIPKKSGSGIIGLGPKNDIIDKTPCFFCERMDCQGREMQKMFGDKYAS